LVIPFTNDSAFTRAEVCLPLRLDVDCAVWIIDPRIDLWTAMTI
jgi:hypothetical protein